MERGKYILNRIISYVNLKLIILNTNKYEIIKYISIKNRKKINNQELKK